MVLDNIFLETAQLTRVEDSVTNVDLLIIIIETVQNRLMSLQTVSIVVRRDILQDNVQVMKKDCTEKEVHVLAVGQ